MEAIRVGMLGLAHSHVHTYGDRWRAEPGLGVRVVAAWDHDAARLEAATRAGDTVGCESSSVLLRRGDIRAVVIGAETSLHADLVEEAAEAGKAIVLQKPIALTMEQADRIVGAVERTGVPFTLAWQMRVDPYNLQIRDLLAGGRFGKVYMVRRRHCLCTHLWKDFDRSWHVQPELNGDIFLDDAAHAVDFLYWLLGKPVSVIAELGSLLNPRIPNDNGIAVFRFADGTFGEVSCSFAAAAGENTVEVVCQNGTIVGNYGDVVSMMAPRPPGGVQLKWFLAGDKGWTTSDLPDVRSHGERIAGLAGPLAEFLRGSRGSIATAAEGRDVLRMTLACRESAQTGRRIGWPGSAGWESQSKRAGTRGGAYRDEGTTAESGSVRN